MCATGYLGPGCAMRAPGFAFTGRTPFVVVKCPSSPASWVALASYLVGKDVLLFSLAASSMLGSRAGRKQSAILLNQAMALGTVAGMCLSTLLQVRVIHGLKREMFNSVWDVLLTFEAGIDLFTGQGTSFTSADCLAAVMFPSSLLKGILARILLMSAPPFC